MRRSSPRMVTVASNSRAIKFQDHARDTKSPPYEPHAMNLPALA